MAKRASTTGVSADADQAGAALKKLSTRKDFDNLKRFGITAPKAFGVSMASIQKVAKLFDRTPHALAKVTKWSASKEEFVKRAATDDRNFVKKGVSWALRGIGHRSPKLNAEATKLAHRLAESPDKAARWIGRDALRDLLRLA